jgi:protein-S-isoprenylcysteine O-methyltransferase Ste14
MSLREGHELVTTGPYRFVRHPIYSGVLLALLGSGLAAGSLWFLILALTFPFYIYSAWEEERVMMRQFPDAYPEYKRRTSALIPFVW